MKRYVLISLFIALVIAASAQAPEFFSYQAVLRNSDGSVMETEVVTVQIVIRQETADGFMVYLENHNTQTTELGIINLNIGAGTTSDDFSLIDWSDGIYFLEVTVNGIELGTTQLLSVPYALYAKEAGGGFSGSYLDLSDKPWEVNESGIVYDQGKALINNPVGDIQLELPDQFPAGGRNLLIGDDAYLTDVDIPNTLGIYSHSDSTSGSLKLGANGPVLSGSNNSLGIGTTEPDGELHLYDDDHTWLIVESSTATKWVITDMVVPGSQLQFSILGTDATGGGAILAGTANIDAIAPQGLNIYNEENSHIAFFTNGYQVSDEKMRITSEGNLGIGNQAPDEKLVVSGAIKVGNGGYSGITDGAATPVPNGGAGTIIFLDSHFFGWDGSAWQQLD